MDDARRDWNDYEAGPLYYALEPIYRRLPGGPPRLVTAAAVTCMATGVLLAGSGGSGLALSPAIVEAINMRKQGGKSRVVMDAEDYDAMQDRIRELEAEVATLQSRA